MKFNYLIVGLLCTLGIGGFFAFKTSTLRQAGSIFVVGTAGGYAPWVSINEQGTYEGFDIDVIHALAKEMNKKLVLKDLGSMSALFMALEQNKIDAIIWGMSITQDRLKRLAMVRYQGDSVTSFPLLFWNKIPDNIKSIQDMIGKTVCVEPASSQDTTLSTYPFIKKIPTEKVDDALLNIQYGKADAAFVEPAIAKKFKKKYPKIQTINVPLAPENQAYGVGICIKKNNTPLINEVKQTVNTLVQKGTIQKLETKWDIS